MFSFQADEWGWTKEKKSVTYERGHTIQFSDRSTIISDKRRKTLHAGKIKLPKKDEEEDHELNEILSLGSIDIEPDQCQLTPLIAMVMACLVDDAAEACCIMGKTFRLPDVNIDMTQKSLQDRNEELRSYSTLFNPETLEDYSKTQDEYRIRKLHTDIVFLQNILVKGVKSLLTDNNFHPWLMYIDKYDLQLEQDARLLQMVEKKIQKRKLLKDQLIYDKIQSQVDSDNLSLAIGKARDNMEDFIIQAEIERVYLDNWENSRRQQNIRVKTDKENLYESRVENARKNIKNETRVHMDIESYMTNYFKDTEDAIQDWMNTYDRDIENKEEEIMKMGFNIETLGNQLTKLQEDFTKRTEDINNWLERKAEKRRIEEENRFRNQMATKIQAWWRGTMVRKKLGPYRPKSKRRKDKKKKKKK
ncbi:hypothetical protein WA026_003252 [Henosepilachna vigintioctopunctata]|uniref:Dynein regulatory complex protein 9 n=1 Tax=Henosepilachna vigintioctopunctata TaxID=420089 RepID=A0AAW1TMK5_9CUCU